MWQTLDRKYGDMKNSLMTSKIKLLFMKEANKNYTTKAVSKSSDKKYTASRPPRPHRIAKIP
jgi:hypothetical protein